VSGRWNPAHARRHWLYSRAEVRGLFSRGDSTISNWISSGLAPIDDKKPQLFAGHELRRFLTTQRWPHGHPPAEGRLFCHSCFQFRALVQDTVQTQPVELERFIIKGQCASCATMLSVTAGSSDARQVRDAAWCQTQNIGTPWTPTGRPGTNQHDQNCDAAPSSQRALSGSSTSKFTGHSSDACIGGLSGDVGKRDPSIPPESCSSNQRWLYDYRVFLEGHQEWEETTIDEHLRSLAHMSASFGHRRFETVNKRNAIHFKAALRQACSAKGGKTISRSTMVHTLQRCKAFFTWLERQPNANIELDLAGYFNLARKEYAAAATETKGTELTYDIAMTIFKGMSQVTPLEIRNRAMIAFLISTGIRVSALVSLCGQHVNIRTRWINQDPETVDTKDDKHIRTYCLDLGPGILDAITQWANWRTDKGFGDADPFFLPDRHIQPNSVGLGHRPASTEPARCWQSDNPVQKIVQQAAQAAGFESLAISCHDFRKIIHPFLAKRGEMKVPEEVALQLNLGHTPQETIRKHYAQMNETDREKILDELCRRALSDRSELELYLAFERGEIAETDPNYRRAEFLYRSHARTPAQGPSLGDG
jgi:LSD1 subclass zinc finger protein